MTLTTLPLGPLGTNCYIVKDSQTNACALIDPGAGAQTIITYLTDHALALRMILLTHAHFDHVGALHQLHQVYDVPIYVHPADTDPTTNMSHGKLLYTDTYQDGDEVCLDTVKFRVISTPGHTKGSVCLLAGDTLFSGDTLFCGSCGRTDFAGGSMEQMMASLKMLSQLDGDLHVMPGHGESTTLDAERIFNPYMREAMRR